MTQRLKDAGLDRDISLEDIFHGDHCIPFSNVRSAYQQKQFIMNNLPYVVYLYMLIYLSLFDTYRNQLNYELDHAGSLTQLEILVN